MFDFDANVGAFKSWLSSKSLDTMLKLLLMSFIASLGIIFQNLLNIHGWIFYLLFTVYLLTIKTNRDIIKLLVCFLFGVLLAIGIWELTGVLMKFTGSLGLGMSIAALIAIVLVLYLERFEFLNKSYAFFLGLIAYYGLSLPPSIDTLSQIIPPAILGISIAFIASKIKGTKQH